MTLQLLYTVFPNRVIAEKMIEEMVTSQFIVCGHILGEGLSMYMWKGAFEKEKEIYCILKTTTEKVEDVFLFFQKNHPYEAFPLLKISAESFHEPYNQWARENLIINR